MQFHVITPEGDRLGVEALAAIVVRQVIEGDAGARSVARHAQQSHDAQRWGLVGLLAGILAAPARAMNLIEAAPQENVMRLCAVLALAYREHIDGVSLGMQPEDAEDMASLTKFHPPARARQ